MIQDNEGQVHEKPPEKFGRFLQLEHDDDHNGANTTNGFFKQLIEDDSADISIGETTTGSTVSLVPLVQKARIPFISLAGAGAIIEAVKPWVFKTPHTDRMSAVDHMGLDLSAFRLLEVSGGA